MAKFTRILSIDGGGIRGIVPGQILVYVEKLLKEVSGNDRTRIADYFDLIAGTSTGGILTCVYLCPAPDDPTTPRFSAEEAVELYLERGDEIFDVPMWHKFKSGGGVFDERYPAEGLENVLEDYLGILELKSLIKPCLITAYDIKRRQAHFFTQHDAKDNAGQNFYVRDVARATSAAPTYFECALVKSFSNITYPLIDGGVFANNPSLCAYAEARGFPNSPTAKDMVLLSLGTGQSKVPYYYREAKDWGLAEWAKPVIDIMMSGVSETVDYQLQQMYAAVRKPNHYLRIQPQLRHASPEMDNASMENMAALKELGSYTAEEKKKELAAFAKLLVAEDPN